MGILGYMVDISNPEDFNYTGTSVIPADQHYLPRANAFYLGGNTPHVWTKEQIVRQENRYRLPIWVYDPKRPGDGKTDALNAVKAAENIGVPKGKLICLDMETDINEAYTQDFHDGIVAGGYLYLLYESEGIENSTNIHGEHLPWSAHYTNVIHIEEGSWGTQYADSKQTGHPFDISAISNVNNLWDIKAAEAPPAPPKNGLLILSDMKVYSVTPAEYGPWVKGHSPI